MIRALIEVELRYPYKRSIITLLEFCKIWKCQIRDAGTRRMKASFFMFIPQFKKIFNTNPKENTKYKVPVKMNKFIEGLKVVDVEVK